MNKRILSLALSVLVVMPGAVFAKENDHRKSSTEQKVVEQKEVSRYDNGTDTNQLSVAKVNDAKGKGKGQEHKQEAMQKKDEKKAQIETFKTAMRAKHEQMKALREETKALRKDAEKKTEELSAIISDLEAGKKTLSDDMLKALISAAGNIMIDGINVKETAEISTEAKETETKVKGADFNNALASMDKVIAKYQKRLDALKQLNADLDKALEIARLAVAPTPVDTTTTTPAPTQDQTQPTSGDTTVPATTGTTPATTDQTTTSGTTPTSDTTQTTTQDTNTTTTTTTTPAQ